MAKDKARTEHVEPAAQPEQPGEVVAVVREWEPQHDTNIRTIHIAIDAWGRDARREARADAGPGRDYAQIEAAVDHITRRVKSRDVIVEETVTEFVEEPVADGGIEVVATEGATAGSGKKGKGMRMFRKVVPEARNAAPPPVLEPQDARDAVATPEAPRSSLAPPIDHKARRLGWFGPKKERARIAKDAPTPADTYQPQCAALTADGAQCRNSSRGHSKYCVSHKGYQPATTKGIAQRVEGAAWDPRDNVTDASSRRAADTRPRVRGAKDTRIASRKARRTSPRKASGRGKRAGTAKSPARRPASAKGRKAARKGGRGKR